MIILGDVMKTKSLFICVASLLMFCVNVNASKILSKEVILNLFKTHLHVLTKDNFLIKNVIHASQHSLAKPQANTYFNATMCMKCNEFQNPDKQNTSKKSVQCIYQEKCQMDESFKQTLFNIFSKDFIIKDATINSVSSGYTIEIVIEPKNPEKYFKHYKAEDKIELPGKVKVSIKENVTPIGFDKKKNILKDIIYRFYISNENIKKYSNQEIQLIEKFELSDAFPKRLKKE